MSQTVLVPTDFSRNALAAARYAIQLAETLRLQVHVLHAYRPFSSAFQSGTANHSDDQLARSTAEGDLSEFMMALPSDSRVGITSTAVRNSLTQAISDYTEQHQVSLVVMGTHGSSEVRRELLGSNTYDVAKEIDRPLMVIPEDVKPFALQQVVFFSDYHPGDVETLRSLETVFGDLAFAVTLIHLLPSQFVESTDEHERLMGWKTMLEKEAHSGRLNAELVEGQESTKIVNETLKRFRADIALLTVANRSVFRNVVTKSLARAIILNPGVPVLLTSEEAG